MFTRDEVVHLGVYLREFSCGTHERMNPGIANAFLNRYAQRGRPPLGVVKLPGAYIAARWGGTLGRPVGKAFSV